MRRRITIIAVLLAGLLAITIGWHNQGSGDPLMDMGIGGDVSAVEAGPDQMVDAGTGKCQYAGYVWACESCPAVEVTVGEGMTIDGFPTKREWLSPDPRVLIAQPKSAKTMVTVPAVSPVTPGCVDERHVIELRVMDNAGVFHSDGLALSVRCCGI